MHVAKYVVRGRRSTHSRRSRGKERVVAVTRASLSLLFPLYVTLFQTRNEFACSSIQHGMVEMVEVVRDSKVHFLVALQVVMVQFAVVVVAVVVVAFLVCNNSFIIPTLTSSSLPSVPEALPKVPSLSSIACWWT